MPEEDRLTYTIITGTWDEVVNEVQEHIDNGYKCQGGVSVDYSVYVDSKGYTEDRTIYAQAMVEDYLK